MKKIMSVLISVAAVSLMAADGVELYKSKCFSCHGEKASKSALGKSQIIAGWDIAKIIDSVNSYKNGEGGSMKNVMKPIVTALNDDDLRAVATVISSYK